MPGAGTSPRYFVVLNRSLPADCLPKLCRPSSFARERNACGNVTVSEHGCTCCARVAREPIEQITFQMQELPFGTTSAMPRSNGSAIDIQIVVARPTGKINQPGS